ncbi:hypothetical protein C8R45DRAFT_1090672 [Mycena sanguinolenta]|nr:hypothetical protein C8R45DRAFT_1090672 [Mycena sanguinolenta]
MALDEFIELFFLRIKDAPKMPQTRITSVAYGRTRGRKAYPFLLINLYYPPLYGNFPVRLRLQGFDGPATPQDPTRMPKYDTPGERETVHIAHVGESVRRVVGTWRYDILHTMTFNDDDMHAATIVDLLTVACLAAEWNHMREGWPPTIFLGLKRLFESVVTSRAKVPLPSLPLASTSNADLEFESSLIGAFRARREDMQKEVARWSGYQHYIDSMVQVRKDNAENARLRAENVELAERIATYGAAAGGV